jgi:hypothetical protein
MITQETRTVQDRWESTTMRRIRAIKEDEMIAAFLYAELNSPRFCEKVEMYLQQYAVDRRLIKRLICMTNKRMPREEPSWEPTGIMARAGDILKAFQSNCDGSG